MKKTCEVCKKPFKPNRSWQRFCGSGCRGKWKKNWYRKVYALGKRAVENQKQGLEAP